MAYLRLLRVTYVTLCEKYAKPGLFSVLLRPHSPEYWAGRATSGMVLMHFMTLLLLYLHITAGRAALSKITFGIVGGAIGILMTLILQRYVERDAALADIRQRLSTQSDTEKGMRRLSVSLLRTASFIAVIVLLYSAP